jgi:hypothetical protein
VEWIGQMIAPVLRALPQVRGHRRRQAPLDEPQFLELCQVGRQVGRRDHCCVGDLCECVRPIADRLEDGQIAARLPHLVIQE